MAILNCKHHASPVCMVEANISEGDSPAATIDLEYKIERLFSTSASSEHIALSC